MSKGRLYSRRPRIGPAVQLNGCFNLLERAVKGRKGPITLQDQSANLKYHIGQEKSVT